MIVDTLTSVNAPVSPRGSGAARSWRTFRSLALLGVVIVGYLGYSSTSPYHLDVTLSFITYALLALGMYTPVFLGGHTDMAYNVYFAIGAYTAAIISTKTDLAVIWAMPIGAALAAVGAAVLGACTSRLSGFHLALVTLVAGGAGYRFIIDADGITGGSSGIGGIERISLFGQELNRSGTILFGLIVVWVIATALGSLRRSLVGITLRQNRERPAAAESSGVPRAALQIFSLALGAAVASLAGFFLVTMNQFVLADSFAPTIVFLVLFLPIVGGVASPWGAVLGAVVLSGLNQASSFLEGPGPLVFGVVTLAVLIFFPGGVLGVIRGGIDRIASSRRADR